MRVAIVIPAHNEAARIGAVLSKISNTLGKHEVSVVVVDDGSKDATQTAAREAATHLDRVRVLRHKTNLGKGAAAKTGCDYASKSRYDAIVLMDADGQHNPDDVSRLIKPIADDAADLVVGSRLDRAGMPLMMQVGNKGLSKLTKFFFRITVQDTQSGFRAFKGSVYHKIRWVDAHYAMETEMLVFAAFRGLRVVEVAIPTVYHDNYKGTTVFDGFYILKTLLKWRVRLIHEIPADEPTVTASYSA